MKPERDLYQKYPDLLGQEADADLERVVAGLDAVYAASQPPPLLLDALTHAVDEHSPEFRQRTNTAPSRALGRRLSRWRVAAMVALAAVLALAGTVYATSPLLKRMWEKLPALGFVEQARLSRELDLSQTHGDIAVTLERGYADRNQIFVGYTVTQSGQVGAHVRGPSLWPLLADSEGRSYPGSWGTSSPGIDEVLGAEVFCFDGANLPNDRREVAFRLTIDSEDRVFGSGDTNRPAPTDGSGSDAEGPWVFEFSLPIAPSRVAQVNQSVIANGLAVQLERVVVTPSATRVYLRFPATHGIPARNWDAKVTIASVSWPLGGQLGSFLNGDGTRVVTISGSLFEKRGPWTLTVEELIGVDFAAASPETGPPRVRLAGPWVFRFEVP